MIFLNEIKSVIALSAAGYDEIPASIDQSISQSIFSEELKLAKVFPIFKCEDEQVVPNYRPISILQFVSKILKR